MERIRNTQKHNTPQVLELLCFIVSIQVLRLCKQEEINELHNVQTSFFVLQETVSSNIVSRYRFSQTFVSWHPSHQKKTEEESQNLLIVDGTFVPKAEISDNRIDTICYIEREW